jgi:hypothetical protein
VKIPPLLSQMLSAAALSRGRCKGCLLSIRTSLVAILLARQAQNDTGSEAKAILSVGCTVGELSTEPIRLMALTAKWRDRQMSTPPPTCKAKEL